MRPEQLEKEARELFDHAVEEKYYVSWKKKFDSYISKVIEYDQKARLGAVLDLNHNIKIEVPIKTDSTQLILL